MAKDYEKAALQALRRYPRDAEAWTAWGLGLLNEALVSPSVVALPLLEESARKFRAAVNLVPSEPQYWYNLGAATSLQVSHGESTAYRELLTEASEFYEKAIRLRPRWKGAWLSWAYCLSSFARKEEDVDAARRRFYEAEVRFAVAYDLAPDEIDVLGSWGDVIVSQAQIAPDALPLWRAGSSKFAELLQKDSKRSEAWGSWGVCQYFQAVHCSDKHEKDVLLGSAMRKFDIAFELAPNENDSWRWRGLTLLRKAEVSKGEEKRRLFAEAGLKFEKASHVAPDDAQIWRYWAEALYGEAGCLPEPECREFYSESQLRLAVATEIQPDNGDILCDRAVILSQQALYSPPDQAVLFLDKALALIDNARELDHDSALSYSNRSFILLNRSRFADGAEKQTYLMEAVDCAERSVVRDPSLVLGWSNWGLILVAQGVASAGEERTLYLESAREKLDRAGALRRDSEPYARAALAALEGNAQFSRERLLVAEENDDLISRRFLREDDAFASVRGEEWFRELLERMAR